MSEPHCTTCTCPTNKGWEPDWTVHPGETLKELIGDWKLPQKAVAKVIGVSEAYLSDVLRGKRGISAQMAVRLEALPGPTAEFWSRLQGKHDVFEARQARKFRSPSPGTEARE